MLPARMASVLEPRATERRAEISARGLGQPLNPKPIGRALYPPAIPRYRLAEEGSGHRMVGGARRKPVRGPKLENPPRCPNLLRMESGGESSMT